MTNGLEKFQQDKFQNTLNLVCAEYPPSLETTVGLNVISTELEQIIKNLENLHEALKLGKEYLDIALAELKDIKPEPQ